LFHFKLPNSNSQSEDVDPDEYVKLKLSSGGGKRRSKRFVESKLDIIRRDDRVEYVWPQRHLKREKRNLNLNEKDLEELNDLLEQLERSEAKKRRVKGTNENHQLKRSDLDIIDEKLDDISNGINSNFEKRRSSWLKNDDFLLKDFLEKKELNKNQLGSLDLPDSINFNDEMYSQQWYLINEGQFKIPRFHDLNVRQAWLNGYTGKNVTIVIVDDGLDYEHPDFEGKYV
jgi:subtilisin family serine protease